MAVPICCTKVSDMWLYGVSMRRKLSKQNSALETPQGQWFPSLLGWSPGNPATRKDPASIWGMESFSSSVWMSQLIHFFIISQLHISSGAHRGGKQCVGRRDADSPMQHQGQQLSPLPFSGWLENYLPVGWFPSTCSAPLWIFMLLY